MNKIVLYLALLMIFCQFSCSNLEKERPSIPFYYPLGELEDGLVYEYQPVENDSLPVNYWFYKSMVVNDTTYLIGNNYDQNFRVQQFIRERINSEVASLVDFRIYEENTENKQAAISVSILKKNVFSADTTATPMMKLKWNIPGDVESSITLNRTRSYLNSGKVDFEGKSHLCRIFKLNEHIEHFIEDDGYLEPEFPGVEIYANGIGLVYYKKLLAENVEIEYQLKKRYSMEEFEEKFHKTLQ